jgi:lipopolysaccharide heptosyltransferase II
MRTDRRQTAAGRTNGAHEPSRILVLRLSALGDVLFAMPAVSTLRRHFPGARITWLVEDRHADVLAGYRDVDEIVVFERRKLRAGLRRLPSLLAGLRDLLRLLGRLRRLRFDTVVDFQGNLKSALFCLASGSPRRIGFDRGGSREFNHLFSNVRVRPPEGILHRIDKDLSLVRSLGISDTERIPAFVDDPGDRNRVDRFLEETGLAGRSLAILHPGTSDFGAFKRWPTERFARLGDRLVREFGLAVLVTFGPGEETLARRVVDGMDEAATEGPRGGSLRQALALLRRGSVYVGADTGLTHAASLLGLRTVALFGPKDPRVYAPRGDRVRVVTHDVECRPCGLRKCLFDETHCMTRLEEGNVVEAVRDLLRRFPVPERQG